MIIKLLNHIDLYMLYVFSFLYVSSLLYIFSSILVVYLKMQRQAQIQQDAFKKTIKKILAILKKWPSLLFLDQDGKLYYGTNSAEHLLTIKIDYVKMVLKSSVTNSQPGIFDFFQEKVKFLCPHDKEIIETKRFENVRKQFKLPSSNKLTDEFIAKGVSSGTLCIVNGELYNTCMIKKLVEYVIHGFSYKIKFSQFDSEKNFRSENVVSNFAKIFYYVGCEMWNGNNKYYQNRIPYLMLKDGTPYNETQEKPSDKHIVGYLFNDIICREICSFIGPEWEL